MKKKMRNKSINTHVVSVRTPIPASHQLIS